MIRWTALAWAAAIAGTATPTSQTSPRPSRLDVTVKYGGTEKVDAKRPIFVFLFDGPAMGGPGSRMVAVQQVKKNGASATFTNVPETVYIAAVFDPSGTFTGLSGMIPGSVVAGYAKDGDTQPTPVKATARTRVTLDFDGSSRLPGKPNLAAARTLHRAKGIVEIRTYRIKKGMRDKFVEFFEKKTLAQQKKAGLHVAGQFRSLQDEDTFVWIRIHESEQARIDGLREYYLGPDWIAVQDEGQAMIAGTSAVLLEPTRKSKIR